MLKVGCLTWVRSFGVVVTYLICKEMLGSGCHNAEKWITGRLLSNLHWRPFGRNRSELANLQSWIWRPWTRNTPHANPWVIPAIHRDVPVSFPTCGLSIKSKTILQRLCNLHAESGISELARLTTRSQNPCKQENESLQLEADPVTLFTIV